MFCVLFPAAAQAEAPHGPVSMPKAWKEMVHRYLAASLGFIILVIAALAWRRRAEPEVRSGIALALVGVVIFVGLMLAGRRVRVERD